MKIWDTARELAMQTPPERNRYVDLLRSLSIMVVIVGHWLMATAHYVDGALVPGQILQIAPNTQWVSWFLQVMPVFFIVGGYANAVSLESARRKNERYADWLSARLNRLVAPLLVLLVAWALIAGVMWITGVRPVVIQYASQASLIPIWFLAIYIMVVVLAPLTYRFWLHARLGSIFVFVAAAIATDLAYFFADMRWLGWTNFFWVWLAVHQLGFAWRDDKLPGVPLLTVASAFGFLALAVLILYGPYPVAMVGSPDEGLSNTSPPKVTLLALALFQFGLLMALQKPARRLLDNLHLWTGTVLVNSMIMTVYLWHITVMAVVVALLYLADGFGLGFEPASSLWWLSRPLWIAVLFLALLPIALLLSPLERTGRRPDSIVPPAWRQVTGAIFICLAVALLARFGFAGGPIPHLDIAAFAVFMFGAALSGLLPTVPRLRIGPADLKILGIWLLGAALVYSAYSYLRINQNLGQAEQECFDALAERLETVDSAEHLYRSEYERLESLVEHSLAARAEMLKIWNRLRLNSDMPLASRDLATLKDGTDYYLSVREELYGIANAYECGVTVRDETLLRYNIDPLLRMKGVMLSLASALTLFDNYLLGLVLFEQDDRLRRLVNDPDQGFGIVSNQLAEATLSAHSIEHRIRVRTAIDFYETNKASIADVHEDSEFAYLAQLIESSPSYDYVKQIQVASVATNKIEAIKRITEDFVAEAGSEGLDIVSSLFGNTVGLHESRKGKLYGDVDAKRNIQSVLQPLDILLEKTPFRLTDKLIPGHFGHVAIWTGTKAELVELGVWDHPVVQQYTDQVGEGPESNSKDKQQIIEALRNGVQLSTLDEFMNVDDVAILRPVFQGENREELTREALLLAFRQIGKEYDFNFDVNTTDKIVCSELAYVSYPSISWPTEKTLGRYSISPDNVAQLALDRSGLELVLFYHDGVQVEHHTQLEKMKLLMQQ